MSRRRQFLPSASVLFGLMALLTSCETSAPSPVDAGPVVPRCLSSQTLCDGGCVDLSSSYDNCGACGNACTYGHCWKSHCEYCGRDPWTGWTVQQCNGCRMCSLACENYLQDVGAAIDGASCGDGFVCKAGDCVAK